MEDRKQEEYKVSTLEALTDFVREIELDAAWIWGGFGMLCITFVLVVLGFFIFEDKSIRGYYLKQGNVAGVTYTCIYTNTNWDSDDVVFCTTDTNYAIEQVKQLNETLK